MELLAILLFVQLLIGALIFTALYFVLKRRQDLTIAKANRRERSFRRSTIRDVAVMKDSTERSVHNVVVDNAAVREEFSDLIALAEEIGKRADQALLMTEAHAKLFNQGYVPQKRGAVSLAGMRKSAEDRVIAENKQQAGKPIVRGHEDEEAAA